MNKTIIKEIIDRNHNVPYSEQKLHFVDWTEEAFDRVEFPERAVWSITLVADVIFDEINKVVKTAGGDYTDRIVFTIMVNLPNGKSYFWNIEEWVNVLTGVSLCQEMHPTV